MLTSEILNKAADEIERRGWTTGAGGWPHPENNHSPVCLEGGIMAAMDQNIFLNTSTMAEFYSCPAYQAVKNYLGRRPALYMWNDTTGRTAAEVIEVLRATAVIEAAREQAIEGVEALCAVTV